MEVLQDRSRSPYPVDPRKVKELYIYINERILCFLLVSLISILITGCSPRYYFLSVGFETTTVLYEPLFPFSAVAGIGPYNSSLATPEILEPTVAATFISELYPTMLHDAQISTDLTPHSCSGDGCLSTFIVGPIGLIQPPPLPISSYPSADTIFVHSLQGVETEFWDVDSRDRFNLTDDCKVWGTNDSAIQVCISASSLDKDHLIAGIRTHLIIL